MQTDPELESALERKSSEAWRTAESCDRFVIMGRTRAGATFRPSDWCERLAGVMSQYRPRSSGLNRRMSYSPYVVPSFRDGVKCVVVDRRLRDLEPMALSFLVNFAIDNDLVVIPFAPANAAPTGVGVDARVDNGPFPA